MLLLAASSDLTNASAMPLPLRCLCNAFASAMPLCSREKRISGIYGRNYHRNYDQTTVVNEAVHFALPVVQMADHTHHTYHSHSRHEILRDQSAYMRLCLPISSGLLSSSAISKIATTQRLSAGIVLRHRQAVRITWLSRTKLSTASL